MRIRNTATNYTYVFLTNFFKFPGHCCRHVQVSGVWWRGRCCCRWRWRRGCWPRRAVDTHTPTTCINSQQWRGEPPMPWLKEKKISRISLLQWGQSFKITQTWLQCGCGDAQGFQLEGPHTRPFVYLTVEGYTALPCIRIYDYIMSQVCDRYVWCSCISVQVVFPRYIYCVLWRQVRRS